MAKRSDKTIASNLSRAPVVVVLGHVDHGKTTLLDAIRKTDVAGREYGGITQSIGAYQVTTAEGRKITFIDTPGHEAFTKMRSRGASVADIAILVVAANDSVMPQTAEAIKIIKAAAIPYIVAISKVDLPEANVDKAIKDLLKHEVMLEGYGGDIPFVKISAKKGEGIAELLDLIGLVADIAEIKGDLKGALEAVVIEAKMDKRRGPVATVIVKNGTLTVGDKIFVGNAEAKIRALIDDNGKMLSEAGPSTPVEILGLALVPAVGEKVTTTPAPIEQSAPAAVVPAAEGQELNLILKADSLGSLEAISVSLPTNVRLLSSATGEITEKDVLLAKSTSAVILGFNVKVSAEAEKLAESEKVLIRTYKIIYELLDQLRDAAAGMLAPKEKEEILGTGQIIAEFPYEKLQVAGTRVTEGRIARGDRIKIIRGEEIIGEAKIKSLRVGKEDVSKAEKGKDCGILLEPQVDFQIGDDIISYRIK